MKTFIAAIGVLFLFRVAAAYAWTGIYTDRPNYAQGETISVHASAQSADTNVTFRLVRIGTPIKEIARSAAVLTQPQKTPFGSFVEFPQVDMAGMTAFTLEGWFYPTLVGGDTVVIAGQIGTTKAAAGIGVTKEGKLAAYLSSTPAFVPSRSVVAANVLPVDTWHHVAVTFDGSKLILYLNGQAVRTVAAAGPVAATGLPFRLGARAEAPGDLTGIIDGRIDSWALWPRALSDIEIRARRDRGLAEPDPAPPADAVKLYAGFEDAYGKTVLDGSLNQYTGNIINHGVPRVSGRHWDGLAIRLHHDQIVDAQWPQSAALTIPADAPSGLYLVQMLTGQETNIDDFDQNMVIPIGIRPAAPKPGTRIAIVLPTNTWQAYNPWPAEDVKNKKMTPGITDRTRTPSSSIIIHGGNNSVYGKMSDGISTGFFTGWRRPNPDATPVGWATGFSHTMAMSRALVEWLDTKKPSYDVYTDRDLDRGLFPVNGAYRLVVFHGHQEYWSRQMLDTAHAFLNAGKSLLNMGGNMLTWRIAVGMDETIEIRKWPTAFQILGEADMASAVDGQRGGSWRLIELCRGKAKDDVVFGGINDTATPQCDHNQPTCFGQWSAKNATHWLWNGLGVNEGNLFGNKTKLDDNNVVGHEMDSVVPGYLPPGLMAGTTPVVLAEGTNFGGGFDRRNYESIDQLECSDMEDPNNTGSALWHKLTVFDYTTNKAGTIAYYRHQAGGRVLSIGATATPMALGYDPVLTALVERAGNCFAFQKGCGD